MSVTAVGAFDQATAVRRTADGRYDMQPDPRFSPAAPSGDFQPAVNGGVLIAAMLHAVLDTRDADDEAECVAEMGGRAVQDEPHMVTETAIRGLYQYYRRIMSI